MNGKQLKNSILQWAIQGKLVPQDPNDEPASVLLERIRAEKVRLVKEGKIKKDKNESIIYRGDDNSHYEKLPTGEVHCIDAEIPFEIPSSWCWTRLGNIVDFSKSTFVKTDKIKSDDWLLDLEDIEKDSGKILVKKRMRTVNSLSDKHSFKKGNVLYSKLRPYLNKVVVADEDGFCTSELLCFDFGEINNYYAQVYLMSPYFVEYAMKDAYGVKMPRLGSKQGNNALIPIPPVQEQYRIVERIKVLQPLIDTYGNAQTELDSLNNDIRGSLKKSLLQEAIQGKLVNQCANDEPVTKLLDRIKDEKKQLVKKGRFKAKELVDSIIFKGDDKKYYEQIGCKCLEISDEIPFSIPDSWTWCRFGEYVKMKIGKTPARGETAYWSDGAYPWVSISDMSDYGRVAETKEKVSEEAAQRQFGEISPIGTLLMSFKLTVGRTSILEIAAYHNEAIISIFPYLDESSITRDYLFYVLPLISNLGDSKDAIKGKTLNSLSLYKMLLPVPPLHEQKRIVERIQELYSKL